MSDVHELSSAFHELRRVELFAELDRQQFARIQKSVRFGRLDKGEQLYRQGEPAHSFYVLRSGKIKLFRVSPDGHEKVVDLVRPGKSFAETTLFADSVPLHATYADALEPSELLCIDQRVFKSVLEESPSTCLRVMRAMSRQLHRHLDEIDRLTLHDAIHRLVCFLLEQDTEGCPHSPHICLGAPKQVIASRLSIKPETLSRMLQRLERLGLIGVNGQTLELRDLPGLRALVGAPTPVQAGRNRPALHAFS